MTGEVEADCCELFFCMHSVCMRPACTSTDDCRMHALCLQCLVNYTSLRVPNELWERIKTHAEHLKKSATATAVECISDSLDQMEASKPGVPRVVELAHFLKKKS